MQPSNFFILKANHLRELEAELLAADSFDQGALGTEEVLAFEQLNRDYEPVTLTTEYSNLKIYFAQAPAATWLESVRLKYHDSVFEVQEEQNRDWLSEWKKNFVPFELTAGIWIVPTWCEPPSAAKQMIRMDPGMAFGTGTHETTRLAADILARQSQPILAQGLRTLLDVGTGTGILAFLAELKGFTTIVANDIDPEARRVARENAILNNLSTTQITDAELHEISAVFGVVIANIIDGVLVRLQVELKKRVRSGGYLLLTGILAEREALFLTEFSFAGFTLIERATQGEWVGFLLRKTEQ